MYQTGFLVFFKFFRVVWTENNGHEERSPWKMLVSLDGSDNVSPPGGDTTYPIGLADERAHEGHCRHQGGQSRRIREVVH